MPRIYYHVAPRYTGGSPAMVDEGIAMRVAEQEKRQYQTLIEHGDRLYGPGTIEDVQKKGLEAIVYSTMETRATILVTDQITGAQFAVPLKFWGASAPDGQQHWHRRTDRDQFRVDDSGQTQYTRRGKQYLPVTAPQHV